MSPFQKFDKLIFVILIRYINTKLLKSCSKNQKLLEVANLEKVAPNTKSCSKVAEHNLSGPSVESLKLLVIYLSIIVVYAYGNTGLFMGHMV